MAVELTGLTRDALHIHIALLIFFGVCLIFRWKAWQVRTWLFTLVVALFNEAADLYVHYSNTQIWLTNANVHIDASVHDILNTMFAPTLIAIFARWSRIFEKPKR